jgi:D-methionine transport system substrate-binding protein
MGFYSKKYKSFADLPEGATVAIQNDPTNGARSLQILAGNKFIKLRDPSSVTAGVADIVENPKKLRFVELDAAQLSRSLDDVDAASINNNYAVQAGLDPTRDSLIRQPLESPWVNIIAVREEDKDKPWGKKLADAYRSEPVKQFILTRFKGAIDHRSMAMMIARLAPHASGTILDPLGLVGVNPAGVLFGVTPPTRP